MAPTETRPEQAMMAVYEQPNQPFQLRLFALRAAAPGEVLVKVRMCTICRSDIHSYQGHRPNPVPGVLGHEIIGTIVELGEGVSADMRGAALQVGDRITWSEYFLASSDTYYDEQLDLPQKARGLKKYGHLAATEAPFHHGGFGQYCYILPRSWIVRLPDTLSDAAATPINCTAATAACVLERAGIKAGDRVVIQGLGLLGLYVAAMAKVCGAQRVIGLDPVAARREMALGFGCDVALDSASVDAAAQIAQVREQCGPDGADVVIEVCGDPQVVPVGLQCLRNGGVYALAGVVNPQSMASLDLNLILRRLITLVGVHNYHPKHLARAVDFVNEQRERFDFDALVQGRYRLDQVDQAMRDAAEHRVVRAAIVPWLEDAQ